jgi:tRNA(Ile)-lysidine synthase
MRLSAAVAVRSIGGALTASEFSALMAPFAPFESRPALAVAVSGGRDSLALALLAHEWAGERGGRALALTVDHGLRPESATEARTTGALLRRHGIEVEILRWTGDKPGRGIQQAAREARYRLLLQACVRRGILHLLLAHHADDQNETVAMRAARDSGPDGLAGMAALVEHRDARLLRPLLPVTRARLTATLLSRGIPWIDDPSNTDPRFERARLRRMPRDLATPGRQAGSRRTACEVGLAKAAVDLLQFDPDGRVAFDQTAFRRLSRDTADRLLSRLVQALGGGDHPPRRARRERAVARLSRAEDRGKSGKGQDFTFSGCLLALRKASDGRRRMWIVQPESGRNGGKNGAQPLIPAGFFACDAHDAHHVDSQPS